MEPLPASPTRWKFRFSTQNPFYLISAACFIHSLSYAVRGASGDLQPVPRLALIAGYLAVIVATSLVLVRKWKLWDDARSLLLIILLLFVEMDLAMDVLLVRDFHSGVLAAAGILAVIAFVSEGVFRGLRLAFPARYRVPYYLLWAALTAWPVVCAAAESLWSERATRWVIAGFLPVCSLLLLTLLPAARRGREEVLHAGHGWPWPLYPWSAFAFIVLALLFRQHALCVSFDRVGTLNAREAYSLVSIYGVWMGTPVLFAIAMLILERAIAGTWKLGRRIACAMPLCGVLLALPGETGNVIARGFVQDVTQTLGSPAWLALLGCIAFQSLAWGRGVRAALPGLLIALLLGSVVGRETVGIATLTDPSPYWLSAAALLSAVTGIAFRSLALLLFGGMAAICAAGVSGLLTWRDVPPEVVAAHLLLLWLLVLGSVPNHPEASLLRGWGAFLMFLFGFTAMIAVDSASTALPYMAGLGTVAALFGWVHRGETFVNAFYPTVLECSLYVLIRGAWESYAFAWRKLQWDGFLWLSFAVAAFAAGIAMSAHKARRREAGG